MEQISIILSASITLLAVLSGFIFAAAEGTPLAAMSLIAGLAGWLWCDRQRRIRMPRWGWNLGGALAIAAAGYELATGSIEARLLSGGHLLVYLTCLFLLQTKTKRSVWWLAVLSVLQVAVASVLTSAPWFGIALFAWLFLAMWTMALFTMHRAVSETLHGNDGDETTESTAGISLANDEGGESYCISGVRPDDRLRLLTGRFVGSVATMTTAGLVMAVLFFLLIPRVWMSRMRVFDDTGLGPTRGSEFTDQVRLGDIGEIMASHEVALETTISDHWTGLRLPAGDAAAWLGESPLFRAKTLEQYRQGRWESTGGRGARVPPAAPMRKDLLRIEVQMKAMVSRTLLTLGRTITCEPESEAVSIERRALTDEYVRTDDGPLEALRYSIFVDRQSSPPAPRQQASWQDVMQRYRDSGRTDYEPRLLQLPPDLKTVVTLTARALSELPRDAGPETRARRIESFLRDGNEYAYSVRLGVSDPTIDPLEDFLKNRKSGHCEYFASALVMMLRAAGIPARLVTGYKGGDWDEDSGVYVVQQRHAHAWVEAQIDGAWITLDATPAERDLEIDAASIATRSLMGDLRELFSSLWSSGVTLNGMQQREMIYAPLVEYAKAAWERLRDIRGTTQAVWKFLVDVIRNPEEWLNWKGGLTVFTLLSALVLILRSLIRLTGRLRSWSRAADDVRKERPVVEFYEAFREMTARAGLVPSPSQTAEEFGETVSDEFGIQLATAGLGDFPSMLSREFYRVRFGEQTLTVAESEALSAQLERFKACLSDRAGVNSGSHDLRSR